MGKGNSNCDSRPAMAMGLGSGAVAPGVGNQAAAADGHGLLDLRLAPRSLRLSRARGVNLGLAVGDALGAPLEFKSREEILRAHPGGLREMIGGGVWNVEPGQITDDTGMAMALATSLDTGGKYDPQLALANYLSWYHSDPIDIGSTIRSVLAGADSGRDAAEVAEQYHWASGGKSAGNGCLMRCAPLASHYSRPEQVQELAWASHEDCRLTHYDPLARAACIYYNLLLARMISARNPLGETPGEPGDASNGGLAPDPEDLIPAEVLNDPAYGETFCQQNLELLRDALDSDAEDCGWRAEAQMGFVLTGLAVAVRALEDFESYEDGVVWASNLGGDTDTNGAIAGALLGAKYSDGGIPRRWLTQMQETKKISAVSRRIFNRVNPAA